MPQSLPPVTLRRAIADDASALARLGATTWLENYQHLYSPEDVQLYLREKHALEIWNDTLADPHRAVWIAARGADLNVGYIFAGRCKLPVPDLETHASEIHQLYVAAQYHNDGVGARLMSAALEFLESQGRVPVYVGTWSENHSALRFYARHGFKQVGEYGFPVGNKIDRDFILKRQVESR